MSDGLDAAAALAANPAAQGRVPTHRRRSRGSSVVRRWLATLAVAGVAAAASSEADAHRLPHKPYAELSDEAEVKYLRRQTHHARSTIRWWTKRRGLFDEGHSLRQTELRFHRVSLRIASRNLRALERIILYRAVEGDWLTAVRFAGRFFPHSEAWLKDCSQATSEGGWGRWVPNGEGSGAGGWLQFMYGTFFGNVDPAFAEARRRGLSPLPRRWRSWYSRPGQALVGAYMYWIGQRGQWAGWAC